MRAILFVCVLILACWSEASDGASRAELREGREIYGAACAACHGGEGTGGERTLIGFEPPETFPDFARCDQTSVEEDVSWTAIVRDGGPARGFSEIMPAFADALTREQIDAVVGYLRGFCTERGWVRGELNLPKALETEKAFPENEVLLTTALNTQGTAAADSELAYEYRIGKYTQLEVALPFGTASDSGNRRLGIGDAGFGLKRVLHSALGADGQSGSILSIQGEVSLPTGDEEKGFGVGETVFGASLMYGMLLPRNAFLQLQAGADVPRHDRDDLTSSAFFRAALGTSIAERGGYGRTWSPMLEAVAERDLTSGSRTAWDLIPEFQVTLSTRQHVRAAFGYRMPVVEKEDRPRQFMFYLLWDWFDGSAFEGW